MKAGTVKKFGALLSLSWFLLVMLLIMPLSVQAEDDDLYNAPYFDGLDTPLTMMGTQSQLIGASDAFLAWFVDSGSTRAIYGYDRQQNKLLTAGNGLTTVKPVLTGSTIYYLSASGASTTINSFDLALGKPAVVVTKPGQITQLSADGDVLAYTSTGTFARFVSSGQELTLDLKTSKADVLTVSGRNVFWTGQASATVDTTEFAIWLFNMDTKATTELIRSDGPFPGMLVSGNLISYISKNNTQNTNELLIFNYQSKTFYSLDSGGGVSISGNLIVYLSQTTQGKVRGFDLTLKLPFLVQASANEVFVYGKKVIWRRDFTNRQGKGRTYYEAQLQDRPKGDDLPSKRIQEAIPNTLFFYETGHSIRGRFQAYWEKYGGLDQFGFPLTEEFDELNPSDGKVYKTQYFERARFEYHPENKAPYDVLLGLLSKQTTVGREYEDPFLGVSREEAGDKYYFQETGHTISGSIRSYWEKTGGLPVYGFPITEPFQEVNPSDGKTYLVQYFERNRLEYHPENAGTKYEVQLGLLGSQILAQRGWLNS